MTLNPIWVHVSWAWFCKYRAHQHPPRQFDFCFVLIPKYPPPLIQLSSFHLNTLTHTSPSLCSSFPFPSSAMEPSLSSSLREPHHFSPNSGFRTANPLLFQASKRSSLRTLKLGFLRTNSSISSSTTQQDKDSASSVNPVYVPTPQNRDLRTPHSGYVCICWALISKSSDMFLLYFDLSCN